MNQSQWEMIEAGGRTAQSFGVNRLMGQVYMLLYLTENPLSLDELSQEIGVSKASASITCRQLESWGALRKVWKRGDRKDYYEAETNLSSIVHQALFGSLEKKLESARTQIQRSLNLLESEDENGANIQFLRERLKQAEAYRTRIGNLLSNPVVKRFIGSPKGQDDIE